MDYFKQQQQYSNHIISIMEINQTIPNQLPAILAQYTPDMPTESKDPKELVPITMANVGTNRITISTEEQQRQPARPITPRGNYARHRTFEPIPIKRTNGPLIIHDKRWYFRLVPGKTGEYKRARALMDDFDLNEISHHMVVCFTPDTLPGRRRPFRNKDGKPIRIYAFFDSYLEFFEYMQKFPPTERAFYEIIFGELPQKPHFDIDIDRTDFISLYPDDDLDTGAEFVREAVVAACVEVLAENMVIIDLHRDILLYSSHGPDKRSYHLVLNNKCHDGHREAKAFYDAVVSKVRSITAGKYLEFIDKSVYSPRQQFRLVGCQKHGSGRPKVFYEQFWYQGQLYTHTYNEDVTDMTMKKLTIIYESMVSFTSGCVFLPSLIPPKPINQNNLGDLPDLEYNVANQCLTMLREKMSASPFPSRDTHGNPIMRTPTCPFSLKEIRGHLILLKRDGPSHCPICKRDEPHENENPFLFIVGGKVYWDCRRCPDDVKKLFVGYLAMTIDEMQAGGTLPGTNIDDDNNDDEGGEFMFGDYNIGPPTLLPVKPTTTKASENTTPPAPGTTTNYTGATTWAQFQPTEITGVEKACNPTIYIPPPEHRRQNIQNNIEKMAKAWAQKKYIRSEPEDLTGIRTLGTVTKEMAWTTGLSGK